MFRLAALRDTGLFDDGFFLYFDEVELMHRFRRHGWTVRHVPESRVVHLEGASTGLGESASVSRLPAYWYRSRRRYFALTGGRPSVVGADLALLAGRFVAILKALVRPGFRSRAAGLDLLRFGFWPREADRHPSAPRVGDRPGAPPSWMTQR
jgi:GT2 family glycosyltransferase